MDVQDTGSRSPISGKPFSRDEQDKAEKQFLSKTVRPDNIRGASLPSTFEKKLIVESSKPEKPASRKAANASLPRVGQGRVAKNTALSRGQIFALRKAVLLESGYLRDLPSQRLSKPRPILPKPKTILSRPASPKTIPPKPRKILPKPTQAEEILNKHDPDSWVDPKVMAAMVKLQEELDETTPPTTAKH